MPRLRWGIAAPKTRPTDASVAGFIGAITHPQRRADAAELDTIMRDLSGQKPVMWGTSIVGYGTATTTGSQPTPWPAIAFAPRKTELVVYLNAGIDPALFDTLGPHRRGVGCLYIKRLADIDHDSLRTLLARSLALTSS